MRVLVDKETGEEFEVAEPSGYHMIVKPIKKPRKIDWSKVADYVPVRIAASRRGAAVALTGVVSGRQEILCFSRSLNCQ